MFIIKTGINSYFEIHIIVVPYIITKYLESFQAYLLSTEKKAYLLLIEPSTFPSAPPLQDGTQLE